MAAHGFDHGDVQDGAREVAKVFAPALHPLVLCLVDGLSEAVAHCPFAAVHLRRAIGRLGSDAVSAEPAARASPTQPVAVAAYLEFLLPELRLHSCAAAADVRVAIDALRSCGGAPPSRVRH